MPSPHRMFVIVTGPRSAHAAPMRTAIPNAEVDPRRIHPDQRPGASIAAFGGASGGLDALTASGRPRDDEVIPGAVRSVHRRGRESRGLEFAADPRDVAIDVSRIPFVG